MSDVKNLLIVDDDIEIRNLLSQFLEKYHFNVFTAQDGIEMFQALETQDIDLIILDMMLPGEDGLSLCRRLQQENCPIPILILSAVAEDTDRIIGLEVGADDYLTKPFNPRELLARIKAILRRSQGTTEAPAQEEKVKDTICFSDWKLNTATRQLLSLSNQEIPLSAGEYDLLLTFLKHAKRVLSRDQLMDYTKHRDATPFDRSIDMQISRLRQKLEKNPKSPLLIKTVRGGGYLFTSDVHYE